MMPQEMVREFHKAFSLHAETTPTTNIPPALHRLRMALLHEELLEVQEAIAVRNIVGIAQELADLVYVAYGTAITYGIDLDAVIAEVHGANMSKLGEDGKPIMRTDGKVLKSEQYHYPDIARVLNQRRLPDA